MKAMFLVNRSERGKCMKKLFAMVLSGLGILAAGAATSACVCLVIDEPEMSKEMIER
jgi:hypothetical protein